MASGQARPHRCRPAPATTTSTASWLVATGRGLRPGAWGPHGTACRWAPTTPPTRPTSPPISAGAASSAVTIAVLVAVPSLVDSGNIVVPMNPGAGGNDAVASGRPPLGLSDVRRHEPPHQGGPVRRGRGHHQRPTSSRRRRALSSSSSSQGHLSTTVAPSRWAVVRQRQVLIPQQVLLDVDREHP
jgi:hypothetical protein